MAAANKFATILHRYTNSRMAMILVYTMLEWTLISLLLVNGLLSYAVARFAAFFGLKPPCVLCSTFLTGYRSFICDHHAGAISNLAYCSAHRKLAEAAEMCEDCCCSASSAAALMLTWMNRSEEGEDLDLRCSCCHVSLESGFYSAPPWLLKSSLADKSVHLFGKQHPPSHSHSPSQKVEEEQLLEEEEEEGTKVIDDQSFAKSSNNDSKILENICSEERVVQVELIDYSNTLSEKLEADLMIVNSGSTSEEMKRVLDSTMELEKMETLMGMETADTEFVDEIVAAGEIIDFSILEKDKDIKFEGVTCSPIALHDNILIGEISTPREAEDIEDHMHILQGGEEDVKALDEATSEESMPVATEICEPCALEVNIKKGGLPEGPSQKFREQGEVEIEQLDASPACFQNVPRDLNEVEEERVPETPTYLEGMSALHRRFMFDRRDSGTESVDGSITSEVEGSETLTIDHLKAALKAERRASRALYLELEEERSASAIAANQTMAMITRLQEEKAAMQMEALQYQRMMEEQSEYDQEALQLLNELMIKREKEKQELEKELEIHRKRVLVYEVRERKKNTKSKANGGSSSSSATSSADDSDALSSDINGNDEYSDPESKENTPTDNGILDSETQHMIALDESLADFEEERLSILEQLKSLEEKLLFLDDDKPSDNKESPLIERFCQENGHGMNGHYESSSEDMNRLLDDLDSKDIMVHSGKRSVDFRGKQLLPLFDAVEMDNEEVLQVDQDDPIRTPQDSASKMALVQQKLVISEDVENVYERLQALEADREFLRHCVSSLKKGDKGIRLLQEILQHLRDLRSVDLRVRTADDALAQHA